MLPYVYSWTALRLPALRHAVNLKEKMIAHHIDEATVKMSKSKDATEANAKTALELLLWWERSMVRKAGRRPNYHGRYIYDQVSTNTALKGGDANAFNSCWATSSAATTPHPTLWPGVSYISPTPLARKPGSVKDCTPRSPHRNLQLLKTS